MNCFLADNKVISELIYGMKDEQNVDLSIVIPTYKRTDFLKKTIISIRNQKPVKHLRYEVIIVSNDPEYTLDDIYGLLDEKLFAVYRNQENLGMVGNMNRCAVLSHGKYISYIQDDDILLNDYLITIERLIDSGALKDIDCLIPNRYYFYDCGNEDGLFGAQAYSKEKKKYVLKQFLSIGKPCKEFQRICSKDCADTWYNCFGGGPTCGMLFQRDSLLGTNGFPSEYPFAFDFVFFLDFSDRYNVVLYDKYLSVYRMNDSASNRPEVQKDFFRSDMYLLEKSHRTNRFVRYFKDEIIRFSIQNKSEQAQELIENASYTKNNLKYIIFRILRFIRLMRSNTYRRKLLPRNEYNEL